LWLEPRLSLNPVRKAGLMRELERQARLGEVRDIVFPTEALKTA